MKKEYDPKFDLLKKKYLKLTSFIEDNQAMLQEKCNLLEEGIEHLCFHNEKLALQQKYIRQEARQLKACIVGLLLISIGLLILGRL